MIAIDKGVFHFLKIPRLLAFEPKAFAGAAIVVCFASFFGFFPGLLIHVSNHQHLARAIVLHDHRNETVTLFEIDLLHRHKFLEIK